MTAIRNLAFVGLFLTATNCGAAKPQPIPGSACAAEKVGWFLPVERPKTSPDFSGAASLERSQIQALAASLPAQESTRIVGVTRKLFPAHQPAWTRDRLRALPDDVFTAFELHAVSVYDAEDCNKRESIASYLYSYIALGVMRSYQGADAIEAIGQRPGEYGASDIVMTALVLELNGVTYDFQALATAMTD